MAKGQRGGTALGPGNRLAVTSRKLAEESFRLRARRAAPISQSRHMKESQ